MIFWSYRVWARDYTPFVDANLFPVYRKRIKGKKWMFSYWGNYTDKSDPVAESDRVMLERSGFKKVELVSID